MSNHRAYQLYAHITWHTWKRVGCIDQAAANDLESAIRSASDDVGVHVLRRAILADHVGSVIPGLAPGVSTPLRPCPITARTSSTHTSPGIPGSALAALIRLRPTTSRAPSGAPVTTLEFTCCVARFWPITYPWSSAFVPIRSEERRVGKECRSRW